MTTTPLRPSERDALLQSLRAGVTQLLGARLIQVGREAEIAALEHNLDHIAEGGSDFRLVIGGYGSGKTFFYEPGARGRNGAPIGGCPRRPQPQPSSARQWW